MRYQDPTSLPAPRSRRITIIVTGEYPPPAGPACAWEAYYEADAVEDAAMPRGYGVSPAGAVLDLVKLSPRNPQTDGETA